MKDNRCVKYNRHRSTNNIIYLPGVASFFLPVDRRMMITDIMSFSNRGVSYGNIVDFISGYQFFINNLGIYNIEFNIPVTEEASFAIRVDNQNGSIIYQNTRTSYRGSEFTTLTGTFTLQLSEGDIVVVTSVGTYSIVQNPPGLLSNAWLKFTRI